MLLQLIVIVMVTVMIFNNTNVIPVPLDRGQGRDSEGVKWLKQGCSREESQTSLSPLVRACAVLLAELPVIYPVSSSSFTPPAMKGPTGGAALR